MLYDSHFLASNYQLKQVSAEWKESLQTLSENNYMQPYKLNIYGIKNDRTNQTKLA